MIEQTLDIATADGAMETFICRPERAAPFPAVFLLMDAPGIREELRDMARRLATVGYYVLLPNLYYRAGRDTIFGPSVLEQGSAERDRMRAVRTKMTIPPVMKAVAVAAQLQLGYYSMGRKSLKTGATAGLQRGSGLRGTKCVLPQD